ncbi:hypothetical protein ACVQK1_09200, partial [Edwardsiella tarda]
MMQKKRISYAIGSILLLGTSVSASACNPLKAKCIIGLLPVSHNELNKVHQSINRDMVAADKVTLTRAQGYTDNKINQAKNDTRRYTDNEISQAKNDTKHYTDQQIST